MMWLRPMLAALAVASFSFIGALAQDAAQFVDPDTGIIFSKYSADTDGPAAPKGGFQFGVAFPQNLDKNEYLGYLVGARPSGKGWTAVSHTSGMIDSLLLLVWANGKDVQTSFRYATNYTQPEIYLGSLSFTQLAHTVNETHFTLTYRCQGCFQWSYNGKVGNQSINGETVLFGWGQGTHNPTHLADPNSPIDFHDNGFGVIAAIPGLAANPSYDVWAGKNQPPKNVVPKTSTAAPKLSGNQTSWPSFPRNSDTGAISVVTFGTANPSQAAPTPAPATALSGQTRAPVKPPTAPTASSALAPTPKNVPAVLSSPPAAPKQPSLPSNALPKQPLVAPKIVPQPISSFSPAPKISPQTVASAPWAVPPLAKNPAPSPVRPTAPLIVPAATPPASAPMAQMSIVTVTRTLPLGELPAGPPPSAAAPSPKSASPKPQASPNSTPKPKGERGGGKGNRGGGGNDDDEDGWTDIRTVEIRLFNTSPLEARQVLSGTPDKPTYMPPATPAPSQVPAPSDDLGVFPKMSGVPNKPPVFGGGGSPQMLPPKVLKKRIRNTY